MTPQLPPHLVFYDFPTSPFCAKVRSVLMFQGAAFETVNALLPRHLLTLRRRGSGKVPALTIDGRWVTDSTDICHALDGLFPASAVLPPGPRERALCHALEEWCDESLYFVGLQLVWLDPTNSAAVRSRFAKGPLGWLAWRAYRNLIARQTKGQGTGRKTAEQRAMDLARHLDAAESLLADGPFLLGARPWLCDFALFGELRFLGFAPVGAAALAARPALAEYMARMRQVCRAQTARESCSRSG
jgi:glutathione S-transferase